MRPVLSRQEARDFDASAIEAGVPGLILMENAGRGAAHLIGLKIRPRSDSSTAPTAVRGSCIRCADERALAPVDVLVLSGPGNNGGDGYVVARHLWGRGARVRVVVVAERERISGDARSALEACAAVGVPVEFRPDGACGAELDTARVVVDALLGTGVARQVEGPVRQVIEAINASRARVFALDVPSGLDAQTGAVQGVAVVAEHTICFAHLKLGLLSSHGQRHAGRITVSHIGVPSTLPPGMTPSAQLLEADDLQGWLSARPVDTHKGQAGRIAVVAGTTGTLGAARLAARGALRGGAGLATVTNAPAVVELLDQGTWEVMTRAVAPQEQAVCEALARDDVIVCGPGLGTGDDARELLKGVLSATKPTVLDADGLNLVERLEDLRAHPCLVLTPHPGEAGRLLNCSPSNIEADRFSAARRLAERADAVVVLKGPRTLIARPGQPLWVSPFGAPVLATGGSGDVLSGLIAAALAEQRGRLQELALAERAACVAVGVQGLAAERWAERNGDRGLMASEVADEVPQVFGELLGGIVR